MTPTKYAAVICGDYVHPSSIDDYKEKAFPQAHHWMIDMSEKAIVFFDKNYSIIGKVKQLSTHDFIKYEPLSQ